MRRLFFPTAAVLVVLIGIADPTLGVVPAVASLNRQVSQSPAPVPVGDPLPTAPTGPTSPPPVPTVPLIVPETTPGQTVPGQTAPGQTVPPTQPGVRTVVLTGHGYGHGRGMGQWGAYGYAVEKGWNYRRILDYFYGNTAPGKLNPQSSLAVRLISNDNKTLTVYQGAGNIWLGVNGEVTGPRPGDGQVTTPPTTAPVAIEPGTTIAAKPGPVPVGTLQPQPVVDGTVAPTVPGDSTTTPLVPAPAAGWSSIPAGPSVIRIQLAGGGKFTISESTSCAGPFTVRATVSAPSVAISTGPAVAANRDDPSSMLQLCQASGSRRVYRGELVAVDGKPNQYTANRVLMEDYLRGVVPAEVPSGWGSKPNGMESLKAQAVAARSYSSAERRSGFANTCDTVACQVYLGRGEVKSGGAFVSFEDARTDQAVSDTAGEVRVDSQGTPIRTEFSSSTGGQSAPGAFPPVRDEGDASPANPHSTWTVTLPAARLESGRKLGAFRDLVVTLRDGVGPYGGRVQNLVLKFEKGDVALKSGEFLRAYNLRSVLFDVKVLDSNSGTPGQSATAVPETIPVDGTSGGGVGLANAAVVSTPDLITPTPPSTVPVSTQPPPKNVRQSATKSKKPTTTTKTTAPSDVVQNPTPTVKVKGVSVSKKPKTSVDSVPPSTVAQTTRVPVKKKPITTTKTKKKV